MADALLDTEAAPTAPGASQLVVFPETKTTATGALDRLAVKETGGKVLTIPPISNASTAAQAYTTAEIYLTGSALLVPAHGLQAGTIFRWKYWASKTAGTGFPVWKIYFGSLGTTGDTNVLTITQVSAPTSVTDECCVIVEAVMRSVGSGTSAVMAAGLQMNHVLAITGFSQLGSNTQQVTSAGFNSTTANAIVGLSVNYSTAGAGNIDLVTAEMVGV